MWPSKHETCDGDFCKISPDLRYMPLTEHRARFLKKPWLKIQMSTLHKCWSTISPSLEIFIWNELVWKKHLANDLIFHKKCVFHFILWMVAKSKLPVGRLFISLKSGLQCFIVINSYQHPRQKLPWWSNENNNLSHYTTWAPLDS